jgi:hypothetical protein
MGVVEEGVGVGMEYGAGPGNGMLRRGRLGSGELLPHVSANDETDEAAGHTYHLFLELQPEESLQEAAATTSSSKVRSGRNQVSIGIRSAYGKAGG